MLLQMRVQNTAVYNLPYSLCYREMCYSGYYYKIISIRWSVPDFIGFLLQSLEMTIRLKLALIKKA